MQPAAVTPPKPAAAAATESRSAPAAVDRGDSGDGEMETVDLGSEAEDVKMMKGIEKSA